ncbi:MAG: type II toxin-antitoxin system RelE/ParE family toxin [Suipraeoptans sp.]
MVNLSIPIVWTDLAKFQLEEIFHYYKLEISLTIAKNIRFQIFSATRQLKRFPESGAIEYNLEELPVKFRYLVQGNLLV